MILIDKKFISKLFDKVLVNPRLREAYDLRNSEDDGSQRLVTALIPGTLVPIHRHPNPTENLMIVCGKFIVITYDDNGIQLKRIHLDSAVGNFGCVMLSHISDTKVFSCPFQVA